MDDGGEHGSGRHRLDYYRGVPTQWNMMPQNQNQNAYLMNKKVMDIFAERDAAIEERNKALSEKNAALDERDASIQQRDIAMAERDSALRERDNAIAALHFHEYSTNPTLSSGVQRGTKRTHHHNPSDHHANVSELTYNPRDAHVTDTFPTPAILSEASKSRQSKRKKENKVVLSKTSKPQRKGNKVGEDLNRRATTDGSKAEWDDQDLLNQIDFGESTMPVPICSCTGVPRQCYKWGDGGWQSSCCTTTLSVYPLPQMPNKRHARMGGRKMSGNVFTRLINRLASDGGDLSMPLDLKNYWAKHGTNRYITLK